ncbi:class I SAM-dependent methyltransferase [Bradyrhizobium sp. DN5]|uniref:O-methyltransferase n=1 Tax=Bradyrhizobium sp. DN5 TaxID=3056950 RepID=UPI0035254E66
MELMLKAAASSLIQDENFHKVTARLLSEPHPPGGGPGNDPKASCNPFHYVEHGLGIAPEQGELIYLLCRWLSTKRVAEFATSTGMSTLYLAAALRDNGGGVVIGSELVSAKAAAARRNLRHAGLLDYAEIREGDARRTLRDLGGPVDFVLVDGWPVNDGPSLAREVIEIVAPQVRIGGYVMNDGAEPDFLEFIRDPANGFLGLMLPFKVGMELCVKVD